METETLTKYEAQKSPSTIGRFLLLISEELERWGRSTIDVFWFVVHILDAVIGFFDDLFVALLDVVEKIITAPFRFLVFIFATNKSKAAQKESILHEKEIQHALAQATTLLSEKSKVQKVTGTSISEEIAVPVENVSVQIEASSKVVAGPSFVTLWLRRTTDWFARIVLAQLLAFWAVFWDMITHAVVIPYEILIAAYEGLIELLGTYIARPLERFYDWTSSHVRRLSIDTKDVRVHEIGSSKEDGLPLPGQSARSVAFGRSSSVRYLKGLVLPLNLPRILGTFFVLGLLLLVALVMQIDTSARVAQEPVRYFLGLTLVFAGIIKLLDWETFRDFLPSYNQFAIRIPGYTVFFALFEILFGIGFLADPTVRKAVLVTLLFFLISSIGIVLAWFYNPRAKVHKENSFLTWEYIMTVETLIVVSSSVLYLLVQTVLH